MAIWQPITLKGAEVEAPPLVFLRMKSATQHTLVLSENYTFDAEGRLVFSFGLRKGEEITVRRERSIRVELPDDIESGTPITIEEQS
jgi:hypothetical protein